MAWFQEHMYVHTTTHRDFDRVLRPGAAGPRAGIYRCEQCGYEEPVMDGEILPSDGHQHSVVNQGPILWRLVVAADQHPQL